MSAPTHGRYIADTARKSNAALTPMHESKPMICCLLDDNDQDIRSLATTVRFAGWTFDRLRRQLVSPQRVVFALSSIEFRLLTAFIDHPARVLSRKWLIELTRAPGVDVNDRSVDLAVSRLRQKLGDPPCEPRLIRTMRGEGYCFDAWVSS